VTQETITYVEAIRLALREALLSDERVVILGEDVGLGGGAFRATEGLQAEFGDQRVIDTPICEAAFTGVAVGMALDGMRPVVEYQFSDFLTSGMNPIVNTAAKMHFRHQVPVPLVVRAPAAGGFAGGPFHSQNPEAWFLRTPGLKVVCPSTVEDASLLLGAAIRDPNPVLFFEQKSLYTRIRGNFTFDQESPLSGAVVRRQGCDVTVVSYGAALHTALTAADRLVAEHVEAEVIDLRVLSPLDFETVSTSVRSTSRCVIVHEDYPDYGVGAEIAARIAADLFEELDAPVKRVGSRFWPIPFSPPLEKATLPTVDDVESAIRVTVNY
jgi:pyruvate/2-oxoglutarate/acetoin dehydrogenase E1 component